MRKTNNNFAISEKRKSGIIRTIGYLRESRIISEKGINGVIKDNKGNSG